MKTFAASVNSAVRSITAGQNNSESFKGVRTGAANATAAVKMLQAQVRNLSAELAAANKKAAGAGGGLDLGRIFAFAGGTAAVGGTIRLADEYAGLGARIKLATASQDEFNRAQREVFRLAQENRVPLAATAELYARLSPALKEVGGTQADVLAVTDTFSKSLIVSGAKAAEAESAILQFSQALGAGRLGGEEFNAVNEAAPRFMKALADSIGVPRGQLKALATDGKLTTDVLVKAVRDSAAQIRAEFEQLPSTVAGSLVRLSNAVQLALGQRDAQSGATAGLAKAINLLADNINPVVDAVLRLGYIFGLVFALKGVQAVGAFVTSIKVAQVAVLSLQGAGLLLIAAFSGYQIGKWATENFAAVRNVGILAIRAIMIAKESLLAGFRNVFARIVQAAESFKPALVLAFAAAFDQVRNLAATFYEKLAAGFAALGTDFGDNLALSMRGAAASIRAGSGAVADAAAADIAAASRKAEAAVLESLDRQQAAVDQIKAITDEQLAAPLREGSGAAGAGPGTGTINNPIPVTDSTKAAKDATDDYAQSRAEAARAEQQFQDAVRDSSIRLLELTGQTEKARLAEIDRKFQPLFAEAENRGDLEAEATLLLTYNAEVKAVKVEGFEAALQRAQEAFNQRRDTLEAQVQIGDISQADGTAKLRQAQRDYLAVVRAIETRINAAPDLIPADKLSAFQAAIAQIKAELGALNDPLRDVKVALDSAFRDGLRDNIRDLIDGTDDAGDAFKDLGKGIIRSLQDVAIKQAVDALTDYIRSSFAKLSAGGNANLLGTLVSAGASFFGGSAGTSAGGGGFNFGTGSGSVAGASGLNGDFAPLPSLGFKAGGSVRGAGSGTSDSILARLSNGEYVFKAAAVRRLGVGLLDRLNNGSVSGRMARFAEGGLVGGGSGFKSGAAADQRPNISVSMPVTISGNTSPAEVLRIVRSAQAELRRNLAEEYGRGDGVFA